MLLHDLFNINVPAPYLDGVLLYELTDNSNKVHSLNEERKWVTGRFDHNIGIDLSTHTHGKGQPHAHVLGRRGNELGVVNLNGTPSHGSRFKLHQKDATALRAHGFDIRPNNIVEWTNRCQMPQIIYG
jgi:hypothetical protein